MSILRPLLTKGLTVGESRSRSTAVAKCIFAREVGSFHNSTSCDRQGLRFLAQFSLQRHVTFHFPSRLQFNSLASYHLDYPDTARNKENHLNEPSLLNT